MENGVNTSLEKQVAMVTLSREKALNALTHPMIQAIHQALDDWSTRTDVTLILFPSLQQKVYCAGGDIRWLYDQGKAGFHDQQMQFFADEYRLDYAIHQNSKPVVAIVDGFLIGGGMGLIMPSHSIYATETASFAMPETGIGFFPDVGMSYRLSQCPGHTGLYLALTGQRIDAFEASYLGLVNGVLRNEDAQKIQQSVLQDDANQSLHQTLTQALNENTLSGKETTIAQNRQLIDDIFSAESVERIMAQLQDTPGEWAEKTLNQLRNACPLSLKVTFHLMQKVQGKALASSYQLDHIVAYHFMRCPDFYEGVRAQVIDKDRTPKWQYSQVSDVPQSVVEQFFVCHGDALNLSEALVSVQTE